jgi:hypothetical protein
MYLGTVDPLYKSPGLVGGPDGGLEEAVHIDVVHLNDARGTIWWIPAYEGKYAKTKNIMMPITGTCGGIQRGL